MYFTRKILRVAVCEAQPNQEISIILLVVYKNREEKLCPQSLPTKTMTASASLGILARSFIDLAVAG